MVSINKIDRSLVVFFDCFTIWMLIEFEKLCFPQQYKMRLQVASSSVFVVHRTTGSNSATRSARYDVEAGAHCTIGSVLSSHSQFPRRYAKMLRQIMKANQICKIITFCFCALFRFDRWIAWHSIRRSVASTRMAGENTAQLIEIYHQRGIGHAKIGRTRGTYQKEFRIVKQFEEIVQQKAWSTDKQWVLSS